MEQFEAYLISKGLYPKTTKRYSQVVVRYIQWLKENNLDIAKVKRSQFTDWIQTYRAKGFVQHTLSIKENAVRQYYYFLGAPHNPAESWIVRKDEVKLPPVPIEKNDLLKMYEELKPKSIVDYRNRCMLEFILFQGLKRIEIVELRMNDINFEKGTVFIQSQRRSNARWLRLEPMQLLHLHEYIKKHRKKLLKKRNTDRLFITGGKGLGMDGVFTKIQKHVTQRYPQVINLFHLRISLITHWRKEYGLMETMIMAGHKHVNATKRYETKQYDELHQQLKSIHPLEQLDFTL